MDLGKHVYVQKPLAWSVEECRELAARATGSADADGQPGPSSDDARLINEYIQSGVIGTVSEVQEWTNRPRVPLAAGHSASCRAAAECREPCPGT